MSAGPFWRDVRTLLAQRQLVLGYLIALAGIVTALDLAVLAARHRFGSFSAFSRLEFDDRVVWRAVGALGHSSALVWLAVAAAVLLGAAAAGWLRACYITALAHGRYTWRPATGTFVQLTLYSLLSAVIGLGFVGLFDNDLGLVALLLVIAATPFTMYADYAIVLDEIDVVAGIRASVRVFRRRLAASILSLLVLLFYVPLLVSAAFENGFTDSTHVQPAYLVAWLLAGTLLNFLNDVVLVTLYRRTPLSAGGSADPSEASRPSGGSD